MGPCGTQIERAGLVYGGIGQTPCEVLSDTSFNSVHGVTMVTGIVDRVAALVLTQKDSYANRDLLINRLNSRFGGTVSPALESMPCS